MDIAPAATPADIETARTLFEEYHRSVGVDHCFQGFSEEVAGLPGGYASPKGVLLLVHEGDKAAGCVGVRDLGEGRCELKRLYVRPAYRGRGWGHTLAEEAIARAKGLGYTHMRLDTIPAMRTAIAMYRDLGFKPIEAYCHNPVSGALFFELRL